MKRFQNRDVGYMKDIGLRRGDVVTIQGIGRRVVGKRGMTGRDFEMIRSRFPKCRGWVERQLARIARA